MLNSGVKKYGKNGISVKRRLFEINPMSDWRYELIKKMCLYAREKNAVLYKRSTGQYHKVFSHLDLTGNFRKNHSVVDKAVYYIDEIYAGVFVENNGPLFHKLSPTALKGRKIKLAKGRLNELTGNKEGIERFLMRCCRHYIDAISTDMGTFSSLKSNWPVSVADFLFFNSYGFRVCNFLLYYRAPSSLAHIQLDTMRTNIEKRLGLDLYGRIEHYTMVCTNYNGHEMLFWSNIREWIRIISDGRKNNYISYTTAGCFDIIFEEVEKYETVCVGHFDPEKYTGHKIKKILFDCL